MEPGTLLDVPVGEAQSLVLAYGYAVFVDEEPPPPAAMITSAEPVVQTRDPMRGAGRGRRK